MGTNVTGSRFAAEGMRLDGLIGYAYADDHKRLQITGAPSWADSARYNVTAKAEGDGPLSREQARKMLQTLLADRFQLKFHIDAKEVPGYSLVVAKSGLKLKPSTPDSPGGLRMTSPGRAVLITAGRFGMERLAGQFSALTSQPVVDRTGLAGEYDFQLTYVPDGSSDTSAPELLTAIQEQLGLKLEPAKVPIEILVVDHVEKPSEN
jgi:uncharacterized protein (TIGR03435 family)